MPNLDKAGSLPTTLRNKFLLTFCLTSLIPLLVGFYIASIFVRYPFDLSTENLLTISLVLFFTLVLSLAGYAIIKQIYTPIANATKTAKKIAAGNLSQGLETQEIDEVDELSDSLRTISNNAKELLQRVENLSLRDKLTGLYNMTYLMERLNEEIQRAIHYQRPCSFAYFHIDNFAAFVKRNGSAAADEMLKAVADQLAKELGEFDRAARIGHSEFAIIFPDRNKKKTIVLVENLLKLIQALPMVVLDQKSDQALSVRAGLSENPIDGVSADDLFGKAKNRMHSLEARGNNLIEAFV